MTCHRYAERYALHLTRLCFEHTCLRLTTRSVGGFSSAENGNTRVDPRQQAGYQQKGRNLMPETTARRDLLKVAGLALGASAVGLRAAPARPTGWRSPSPPPSGTARDHPRADRGLQPVAKQGARHPHRGCRRPVPPPRCIRHWCQQLARKSGSPTCSPGLRPGSPSRRRGLALPLDQYVPVSARGEYFPGTITPHLGRQADRAAVDGRLWHAYYRKDLLQKIGAKPPETWDDM